jgi:hypothetical protein
VRFVVNATFAIGTRFLSFMLLLIPEQAKPSSPRARKKLNHVKNDLALQPTTRVNCNLPACPAA